MIEVTNRSEAELGEAKSREAETEDRSQMIPSWEGAER
jgi:hypothetical protein